MVEKISTRSDSPAYRDNPIIVEKINELCDVVNDILDQKIIGGNYMMRLNRPKKQNPWGLKLKRLTR